MKNDLDFIRDQIEQSGVHAPDEMNEGYVLDTLAHVQPRPVAVPQKPKRKGWKIALSATAAVLVVTIAAGVALGVHFSNSRIRTTTLSGGLSLRQFSDYTEIEQAVRSIRDEKTRTDIGFGFSAGSDFQAGYEAAEDSVSVSSSSSTGSKSGSGSYSDTYTQVEGVDEADVIKTDGRYIYCANRYSGEDIVIFSAEGEDSRRVATIDVTARTVSTPDVATPDETQDLNEVSDVDGWYDYGTYVKDLYLRDNRLIVLCNDYDPDTDMTTVLVYDVSDIDRIALLGTNTQSGYYRSSRMIGDTLYTVSNYYVYDENQVIPRCGNTATPDEIPADCVYALEQPSSESFLVISAYDTLDDTAQTESKAILGGVDDIYCNLENLYIYTKHYTYETYEGDGWYQGFYLADSTSQILKVNLTDGIRFTAYAEVEGVIDDQYALDEYQGNLRVATTSQTDDGTDINNLFVLDENLSKIGQVTGFAEDESIKAVRYVGNTAYVITYEQTDPLFVIDLSDPTAPEILGEVKISGFSTMLVPIDENTIMGIGYHTEEEDYTTMEVQEGVKLALFDVSNKANPQVLDSVSYVNCYSPVTDNPKALVYNPERNDFVIPLNYWHYDYSYDDPYMYEEEQYGGMLNFRVENGRFVITSRYAADYDEDVERCVYVDDTVYMTHYDEDGELRLDSVVYR